MLEAIRAFLYDRATFARVMYILCFLFGSGLSTGEVFEGKVPKAIGIFLTGLAVWIAQQTPNGGNGGGTARLAMRLLPLLFLPAVVACTTPLGAWNATLGTYRTLARGAEVYCSPLNAEADPKVCLEAAIAAEHGLAVIKATEAAIAAGTLTDEGLEAKADELSATTAQLEEAK